MKYVHTNIVADDWKRLAQFYQDVLGCVPVPPERDLKGEWVDKLTGLTGAHITGIHLRLPGWGDDGPTLEIFQYDNSNERLPIATNNPGFGHIAFQVDDVEEAVAAFLANGGSPVGELLVHQYPDGRYLTVRYVADPEGNVVELQSWSEKQG
ncbi:VOC family protein [uncultured Pseudodesulfovibrio sp.]|uniref:VOC family protein n=1 Tax=uncultured Pseudodesulfovibrio sp. TaxID=2035858 RepID=UPI0029C7A217|nr:VOC family protein [uncultured Pseudodesulfovibrio sp.]